MKLLPLRTVRAVVNRTPTGRVIADTAIVEIEGFCSREVILEVLEVLARKGQLPDSPRQLLPSDYPGILKISLETTR